jgi:hypothetical protein
MTTAPMESELRTPAAVARTASLHGLNASHNELIDLCMELEKALQGLCRMKRREMWTECMKNTRRRQELNEQSEKEAPFVWVAAFQALNMSDAALEVQIKEIARQRKAR